MPDGSNAIGALTMRPVTPLTGVEITGVDLKKKPDADTQAALRRALNEHCVLFFPDQSLSVDEQVAFSKIFGHVPTVPESMFRVHKTNPYVTVLLNDADNPPTVNNWHSDYSFAALPDLASVLQAIEIPACGGDTLWCNMYAAYEGLSDRMKSHLDGLSATHDFMKLYERPIKKKLWEGKSREGMLAARREFPPVSHPIVNVNPDTGRKALFVNESFTRHVDGMSESESRTLLGFLFETVRTPEYQVRYVWLKGTLAIWDNRSTNHYATADYYPNKRLMHRVTVLEKPRS